MITAIMLVVNLAMITATMWVANRVMTTAEADWR